MANCIKHRRKAQRVCIGHMRDLVTLHVRAIQPPDFEGIDFAETFTEISDVPAMIETVDGKTFFDGVNTDVNITHKVFIRFLDSVTAETWIEVNSNRLDILRAENMDERSEFLKLICTERGGNTVEAAKA